MGIAEAPPTERSAAGEAAAPEALAPPPGHPRFPLFDALRAVAAITVLLVHAAIFADATDAFYWRLVAHLDIGVPFFFLLSGFLLYRPFVAARVVGARSTRIRDYSRRRFLRVIPAYWLALTVLTIVPGLYGAFSENWWVYYGLLQNYPVYEVSGGCAEDVFQCGIAPAWTLAMEVAFYVVLPFFALGMAWLTSRSPRRRWPLVEMAVLGLFAAVSVVIQSVHSDSDLYQWLFYSPLGRGWWFALGMGLAVVSVRSQELGSEPRALRWIGARPGLAWAAAGTLYVVACLFILTPDPLLAGPNVDRSELVAEYVLYGVIAALVALPAVFSGTGAGIPQRVLGHRTLAWLGLISYGIFLWHFPILYALDQGGVSEWWPKLAFPVLASVTFAITVACAALSYYLVERPLMRFK
jgi:peptidoglycan/LPS O-acetylase OafA/YrhL